MIKKYLLAWIILSSFAYSLSANITAVSIAGGTISAFSDTKVELVTEDISFEFFEKSFNVKLDYDFYNHGETEKLILGFPKWHDGYMDQTDFNNISFFINNEKKKYAVKKGDVKSDNNYIGSNEPIISEWYILENAFPKKEHVKIKICYNSGYGQAGFGILASYLFGTGRTWYSDIKQIKIQLHTKDNVFIDYLNIDNIKDYKLTRIGKNSFEIILKNIEPEYLDMIRLAIDDPETVFGIFFGFYDKEPTARKKAFNEKLTNKNVKLLTKKQLLYYKSFFLAFAGYPCSDVQILDFLKQSEIKTDTSLRNSQSWKYNIGLIDEYIAKWDSICDAKIVACEGSSFVDYKHMYDPSNAFDDNLSTAWLVRSKDSGIGEHVNISLDKEITIDEIRVAPGYFDPAWWKANNRVKALEISFDKTRISASFKDEMTLQNITLEKPVAFKEMGLTIMDVYKSNKDDDTAISEIKFFSKGKEVLLN